MVSCCNRRLYKGNSYEICIPITDTGVTSVSFYTSGDIVIEKEGEIVDDTMCFELTKEELDLLPDGVLRYSYEDFDSNTRYVVVTPGDYSGTTLEDIIADAFDSGYTAGQENCSGDTCEGVFESGYTSGHTDGIAEQKAKLVSTAITENGTYTKEDGFSSVEVNVPTGQTINNQVKAYSIGNWQATLTQTGEDKYMYTLINRPTILTYDSGYTGLEKLILNMGIDAYEAVDLGKILQRAKMVSTAITENGTYSREDGYSSIEVNVPQTGHTDQEMQDSWNSGYTSGYTDGLNACSGGNEDLIANIQGDYFIIPEGTTKIRDYAFRGACFSAITIPSSVRTIEGYAFADNGCLKKIVIPSTVQAVYDAAFYSCANLTAATFENSALTSFGTEMFSACRTLKEVKLPAALNILPLRTFSGCFALSAITIPSGVTSIGDTCFADCNSLNTITIPSAVTGIGTNCFRNDTGMSSMVFESTTPPQLAGVLNWNASLGSSAYTWPIYVPCEAVEDYKTAWPYYAHRISCQQEPEPEPVYSAMPLTFRILSDGYINWNVKNVTTTFDDPNAREPDFQRTIYYSKDSGNTWNSVTSTTGGTHIPVLSGETVLFKGDNNKYSVTFDNSTNFSGTTCEYDVYGNIMSLINSTGYTSLTALTEYSQFYGLFGDTSVRSAEHLILPAMELTQQCYRDMFIRCTNLTTAPVLPAQYIPDGGYYFMFYGCNHLTYIKCLATSLGAAATNSWVGPDNPPDNPVQPGLPRHGTFVKSPDMHDWDVATEENYITHGIPLGWTVVDDQS